MECHLTLFEIYFGFLPHGNNPNTKKMNNMIYDEKNLFIVNQIFICSIFFSRDYYK